MSRGSIGFGGLLLLALIGWAATFEEPPSSIRARPARSRPAPAPRDPPVRTVDPAELAAEKEFGAKPKNDVWNASVAEVERYFDEYLHDPDPKVSEWSEVALFPGKGWGVRCKYRARNRLGGYVLKEEVFFIKHGAVFEVMDYADRPRQ